MNSVSYAPATFWVGESGVRSSGCSLLQRLQLAQQPVELGVADDRGVLARSTGSGAPRSARQLGVLLPCLGGHRPRACLSPATVSSSRYSGLSASDLAARTQWARAGAGVRRARPPPARTPGSPRPRSASSPGASPSLRHSVLTPLTLPAGSDNGASVPGTTPAKQPRARLDRLADRVLVTLGEQREVEGDAGRAGPRAAARRARPGRRSAPRRARPRRPTRSRSAPSTTCRSTAR